MGIETKEYPTQERLRSQDVMEKRINTHHIQSGTYELRHHDLGWSLNPTEERIEVALKFYNTYLQKTILDRINPTTTFKSARGYGLLDIELRASFDDKSLLINGNIYEHKPFGYEQHIKYNNVIITSW